MKNGRVCVVIFDLEEDDGARDEVVNADEG